MRRFTISISALLALSANAAAEQTPGDSAIGAAASIEKIVEGLTADRNMRLKAGDAVFFNELLTTGRESNGKFVFDDRAALQMGPQSQVRLDNFVYAKAGGAPGVAFNVTKGALRFISAAGAHKPYEVRTNRTTIGVRGTAFAVRANDLRTDAVLYDGAIEVCLPQGRACRTLDKPCTTVSVTDAGFVETRTVGERDWTFDEQCRSKPAPVQKRRHGAAEPPASPPPGVAPRRMGRAAPLRAAPPRQETVRQALPPQRRQAAAEPARPLWPNRPTRATTVVHEAADDTPLYAPPRFPVRPPIIFGGGPFYPRFPGGGWGGHYPQRPWGGAMRGGRPGYGGMAQRWGRY